MVSRPTLWIEMALVIGPAIFGWCTQPKAGSWIGALSPLPRWSAYEYLSKNRSWPDRSKS